MYFKKEMFVLNLKNISWDTFSKTGSIDMYLLYKSIDRQRNVTDGKRQCERNSNKADKLW